MEMKRTGEKNTKRMPCTGYRVAANSTGEQKKTRRYRRFAGGDRKDYARRSRLGYALWGGGAGEHRRFFFGPKFRHGPAKKSKISRLTRPEARVCSNDRKSDNDVRGRDECSPIRRSPQVARRRAY